MEDKYFWTFGVNSTIQIERWNEEKTYSYTVLDYWYKIDRKGRVTLDKVQHNRQEYFTPDEFAIFHKLLHEAIAELKWMSRVR